ncbi:MAG: hypothetical protein QM791_23790 [Ferruginibacter sp.]
MKSLKILTVAIFALTACCSKKATAQATKKWIPTEYRHQATLTTTDSAYQTIDLLEVASNEAGIIEVQVLGYNDSLSIAVTGKQIVRYKKVAGTLTVGTASNILAKETDTGLSTATWDISTSSNNIIIRVKGRLNYTVKWESRVKIQKKPG